MSTQNYKTIVVTGIMYDEDDADSELPEARRRASAMFDDGLVSALTPSGHNFVASFAIFPTGSSSGREHARLHDAAIAAYLKGLASTSLEYAAVEWGDHVSQPRFIGASDPVPVTYGRDRPPIRSDADRNGEVLVFCDSARRWTLRNWRQLHTSGDWSHWQSLPEDPK